jgi:3-deoxy-D-manno-octulosonic-acid transferase
MTTPPASLRLYSMIAGVVSLGASAWLGERVKRGKEDPDRWRERLGHASAARPRGRLAWLHGVSVGEGLSLLPLVERLREERPDVAVLVTTGTRASAELLATRLPPGAVHQYAPLDTPGAVRRFLDHWRPDLGVLAESELWPHLILGARARGVRLALVSARLSAGSEAGWRRAPSAARAVLGSFDLILARDTAAAERLAALGARVDGLADLKFGARPLPVDERELREARAVLGGRPVLLAASTHPGEEDLVLRAFQAARAESAALLVLVPRHPARGEELQRLVRERGLPVRRRSTGDALGGDALGDRPVCVADTVGELGLWYRLATLAVIGGSLVPETTKGGGVGGHNPLEPARLGCPFVAGPYVAAWPAYPSLEAAAATRLVPGDELAPWFARALVRDPALNEMAARAQAFVAAGDAAADEVATRILILLDPSPQAEGTS